MDTDKQSSEVNIATKMDWLINQFKDVKRNLIPCRKIKMKLGVSARRHKEK